MQTAGFGWQGHSSIPAAAGANDINAKLQGLLNISFYVLGTINLFF